jgi:hypothetical protein
MCVFVCMCGWSGGWGAHRVNVAFSLAQARKKTVAFLARPKAVKARAGVVATAVSTYVRPGRIHRDRKREKEREGETNH